MSDHLHQETVLNRRHWLVLAASTLSGCGGGAGSVTALLPGTGGTGIYAQGSISGFGSVIINGIRFDDTAATVQLDGVTLRSADLRLGMVASVQGERGADPALGTAKSIEVWSIAQGLISQLAPGGSEFTVAGMTVQTDANTVFDGLAGAAALSAGQRLMVWGLQAGSLQAGVIGSRWLATRLALTTDPTVVSTGLLGWSGEKPVLNGFSLMGEAVRALAAGQQVWVQGTLDGSAGLLVASVKVQGAAQTLQAMQSQGEAEIEAMVTAVSSATRFTMEGLEVDASAAMISPTGAQIRVGSRLEVEGSWHSGLLIATKVDVKDEQTSQTVEIKAMIEQFSSVASFVVRGQVCDASGLTSVGHGTLADLRVGVVIKLKGTQAGNVLIVTELEIDD